MANCVNKSSKEFKELLNKINGTPSVKEGVSAIFEETPKLAEHGTIQDYSQYLDTIYPNSEIKDIVYHGTNAEFEDFKIPIDTNVEGVFYTHSKDVAEIFGKALPVIVNASKPLIEEDSIMYDSISPEAKEKILKEHDSVITPDNMGVVFNPNQIYKLGSQKDIEAFKSFMEGKVKVNKKEAIHPIALAAKVSLWQEQNGLDKFPTAEEINSTARVENTVKDTTLSEEDIDFLPFSSEEDKQEFTAFERNLYSIEEIKEARAELLMEVPSIVHKNGATTYKIHNDSKGVPRKITVAITRGVKADKSARSLVERINSQFHPSFGEVAVVAGKTDTQVTISLKIPNSLAKATLLGTQKEGKETYINTVNNRLRELKNLPPVAFNRADIQEHLEFLRNQPHAEFMGYYNPETGEFFKEREEYLKYLKEMEGYFQEEDQEASFSVGPNGFLDPNYSVYREKRKEQLEKAYSIIEKIKAKRKEDGKSPEISKRLQDMYNLVESLKKDIEDYDNSLDVFDTIQELFEKDLKLIEELIANPNLENIFLAKDIFDFVQYNSSPKHLKNVMFSKLNNNGTSFLPEVETYLSQLREKVIEVEDKMTKAIDEQFLNIVEKYKDNLEKLYPGKTLEEIKEELLRNLEDISGLASSFLPQGRNMTAESDLIAQLIRLEYDIQVQIQEPRGQRVIQKLNNLLAGAVAELTKEGFVTRMFAKSNVGAVVNYQAAFFRKDANGNPLPTLLSKFSQGWEKFTEEFNAKIGQKIFLASSKGNWTEVSQLLKEKYFTLAENVEFVDFRLLHDIYDEAPAHAGYKQGTPAEAEAYKKDLIDRIGEKEYNSLVARQINFLDMIPEKRASIIRAAIKANRANGVFKYEDLPDSVKEDIEISMRRRDPALFLDSHLSGQQGEIPYSIGTQTYTKMSYMEYNAYIPRKTNSVGQDNGHYDPEFEKISKNPVLREFLEVLEDAVIQVNENYGDSDLGTSKRSILHHKKGLQESLFEKGWSGLAKRLLDSKHLKNAAYFLRGLASSKKTDKKDTREVQLPAGVMSFENMVKEEHRLLLMEVANILNTNVSNKSLLKWDAISLPNKQRIYEAVGVNTEAEFLSYAKPDAKGFIRFSDFINFSRMIVMDSQTFDLPTMLKAQIEQSMLHKARTIAKQNVDILLLKNEEVKNRNDKRGEQDTDKDTTLNKWNKERTNAGKRNTFFYESTILNEKGSEEWGSISSFMEDYFKSRNINPEDYIKMLKGVFYKNFSPQEKRQFDIMVTRLKSIKDQLTNPTINPDLESKLIEEAEAINTRLTLMGEDYTASAIYSTVINKWLVTGVGLAWSVVSPFFNIVNAKSSMFHRDGIFWTKGNIYAASTFVDMNAMRHIKPSYKEAWNTMAAFVHQMNIIQDGTNELQRAERIAKSKTPSLNPIKFLTSPFHGTAVVEYYNQLPSILSMMMDKTIKHPVTGVEVPLFDGVSFPAHTTDKNGLLTLKDEYKVDANGDPHAENIANFENFDSFESALWKKQIHGAIASLNGDYSESGATKIKESEGGKTLMAFKTWMGEYYLARYSYNQKNIATGEVEDGYVSGSFADPRTRTAATGVLAANTAIAYFMLPAIGFMSGIGLAAAAIAIGGGAWGAIKVLYHNKIKKQNPGAMIPTSGMMFASVEAIMYTLKASTIGLVEMPINYLYRLGALGLGVGNGKNNASNSLISIDDTLGGKLNARQSKNLRGLTRQFQTSAMFTILSFLTQAFLGAPDDDEEEKKGKGTKSKQGKRWLAQQEEFAEKKPLYNFSKNFNQRGFDEIMLGMSVTGSVTPFLGENTVPQNLIDRMGFLLAEGLLEDNLYGKKGSMYYGDTKSSVMGRKALLPSPVKAIGKSQWAGGFEPYFESEFQNNAPMNKIFDSDFKVDTEKKEKERITSRIEKLKERSQSLYEEDYSDLTPLQKRRVDYKVNKEMKKKSERLPKRKDYDQDQQRNDDY